MLDEITSKLYIKTKKVIDRRKNRKTLNKIKPVENTSKNPQSIFGISPMQKEGLPSHKLQDHPYE